MVFNFFNQVKISQAHLTIYKQNLYSLQEDGSFRNGRYITFFFHLKLKYAGYFKLSQSKYSIQYIYHIINETLL